MHPAFSVIFFTTLSGAGYGLMAWVGALLIWQGLGPAHGLTMPLSAVAVALLVGSALVGIGLFSSTLHLGKPLRAWRAFSQWRTSWLSREGVMAVVTYLPVVGLGVWLSTLGTHHDFDALVLTLLAAALAICALLTVACTAMIYASLKPIPAWRHWLVVPGYLAFALLSGAALLAALPGAPAVGRSAMTAVVLLAPLTAALKLLYWRAIDRTPLPITRGEAVGLPDRELSVFERPHTEENYLTREMGYVLARKHARKLRLIALTLFALLPVAGMFVAGLMQVTGSPETAAVVTALSALSVLLGAVVERWLFFAQAKHLVTLYY
jgi:DMSO reductase anchor subunit